MNFIRQSEIVIGVNDDKVPDDMNQEDKEFYYALIKEKSDYEKKYGKSVIFELPTECYNNTDGAF